MFCLYCVVGIRPRVGDQMRVLKRSHWLWDGLQLGSASSGTSSKAINTIQVRKNGNLV